MKLRAFQTKIAKAIRANYRLLVGMDMGLGKTVTVGTAIGDLFAEGELMRVLVVAPLQVAKTTWTQEFAKWDHLGHLRTVQVLGTPKQRLAALATDAQVDVINKENLPWLLEHLKATKDLDRYDMIVVDESASCKEGKKKTGTGALSRFGVLDVLARRAKRIILLSGTPIPEGIEGLWGQMYLIDQGERLGAYKTNFYNRWFRNVSKSPDYPIWEPMPGSAKEILRVCDDVVIKLKTGDLVELPPRLDLTVYFDLHAGARAAYDAMNRDLAIEIDSMNILAPNNAVKVGKLIQMASGTVYDENQVAHEVHGCKIDALKSLLGECDENVVVWYWFKHDKKRLLEAFPHARVMGDKGVYDDWNAGKVKLMLAHPAADGEGVNFQHGGSLSVWFTMPWSLRMYMQANKRMHRQGQTNTVRIYHLLARKTHDEPLYQALLAKTATSEEFFDEVTP